MKLNILFLILILINSCSKKQEVKKILASNKIEKTKNSIDENEILCDSIYPTKNYKISIKCFSNERSYEEADKNAVFTFSKKKWKI